MNVSNITTVLPATEWLLIFAVGAVTGAMGQMIRQIASLKKIGEEHPGQPLNLVLDHTRIKVNLLIGAAAGILGMVSLGVDTAALDGKTILSLIGIGYAGTDFIESFMRKAQPSANADPDRTPNTASHAEPKLPLPLAKG